MAFVKNLRDRGVVFPRFFQGNCGANRDVGEKVCVDSPLMCLYANDTLYIHYIVHIQM